MFYIFILYIIFSFILFFILYYLILFLYYLLLEFLKNSLDDYVKTLSVPTRVLRSNERIGLIKARLLGAYDAKGEVLTFLDAHCECTVGR